MDSANLWFLGAYTAGTIFGLYMGYKGGIRKGAYETVEHLIQTKCLRTRETPDCNVEILSLDES